MTRIVLFAAALAFLGGQCCSFQATAFLSSKCHRSQTTATKMPILYSMSQETSQFNLLASNQFDTVQNSVVDSFTTSLTPGSQSPVIEGLSPETNIIIFIIGIIPFLWATYEFWSRIAVGASFGTGADSIQIRPSTRTIGADGDPLKSRGQQVLGDGALVVAYILFAIALGSVSIAIYSVVSSPPL